MIHDGGAYLPWGIIASYIAATTFPGPYVVPAFRFEATVVLTNRVPTTVVRGAGRPQAVFAMERLMDRVARELAIDRAELRRRNMIRPEQMPYSVGLTFRDGKPLVYASGDFPRSQARAIVLSDYNGFRARQKSARTKRRYIGIGIANYVEGTGLGPFEGPPCASCRVAGLPSPPAPRREARVRTRCSRKSSLTASAAGSRMSW